MDDFKILLQAEIDQASKTAIKDDIKNLKLDSLKIQVDTSNIISSIQKAVDKASSSVKLKLPGFEGGGGKSNPVTQYKTEYQQLMSIAKQMSSMKIKIAGLDGTKNKSEIDTLSKQLDTLKSKYASFSQSLAGKFSSAQWDNLQSVLDSSGNKIDVIKAKLADAKTQMSQGIKYKMDVGDYETQIARIQQQFVKWGYSEKEVETNMKSLNSAYQAMKNAPEGDKRIQAEKEYQKELDTTKNKIVQMSATTASPVDRTNLSNKIQTWLDKNTAASKSARAQLQNYISELEKADMAGVQLKNIKRGFEDIIVAERSAGRLGKSFTDSVKAGVSKFKDWVGASTIVMKVVQTAKDMYQAVYDIDTAMTNLYKVTDETDTRYNKFLTNACTNAKELGRSVSSLVEQSANWAKLGYSLDESEKLAQVSSIYANVGEVDDDTAVSDMVTVMKAYNIAADEAISIVDKYNKLGNEFATSSKDLGEGMSNAASMLALGGTDMNKALALLTGGAEITQSAGELGNALKIGQMRVQGMKGQLEELGEEVDENVDSISKMQTHLLNLTKGEVNIFDDNDNFKDYYDILEETSKVLDKLSSTDRADLLETLFGKNRANQGAAVLQAFQSGQVQKAYEATLNASGSAMQEQERWMESMEAKTQQFQAAFQSMSNTVLNSDLLKFFMDFGTGTVDVLDTVIDKFNQISSFFTGGGNSSFGSIGALSGLLMNKMGIGERTMFQW